MTSTLTPEQIADHLTEVQRRALLLGKWNVAVMAASFAELRLLRYLDVRPLKNVELTPLGLSVRKVLQDREQGGGQS